MVNMDKAIGEGFKKFDTTSVSDALDRLALPAGCTAFARSLRELRSAVRPLLSIMFPVG